MSENIIKLNDMEYNIVLDSNIYSKDAILKTASRFNHRCNVNFTYYNESEAKVNISAKDGETPLKEIINSFLSELLDQQLRFSINEKTQKIHELIIAEAFAPLSETS